MHDTTAPTTLRTVYTACVTKGASLAPRNLRAAGIWNSGGAAYDEISRGIADAIAHAVIRLEPRPGQRILDLATGTGWTSREVARRGATVVGVDIATDLLDVARQRAAAERLSIGYEVGEAEALPFEDAAFDAVISTFGVMFSGRPETAAAELARVVRPGGRVVLATWSPDGSVFRMFQVMRPFMPPPSNPPPPSPFAWGNADRLHALLDKAFEIRIEYGTSFYREPSAQAAWQTFSTGYGPTRTLAASLDGPTHAAFREAFIAFHEAFETPLGICVPRDYVITVGTRC